MTATVIDLIRHGMPQGGERIRGNGVDDPLSEEGWVQMRRTAAAMGDWQTIVSSPMQRCLGFAEWLAGQRRLPLAIEPKVREVGFGAWEGIARTTLANDRRYAYDAFYDDPVHNRPAGAEPLNDFGRRVSEAFEAISDANRGNHVLIVTHAGVVRATLGHALQIPPACWYRIDVANAAVTRIVRDLRGDRLVFHSWLPQTVD